MFSLRTLMGKAPETDNAHALYAATLLAARRPAFYTLWGVPDTPEGRFEMLALTAFLTLHRLKACNGAQALSQAYFDMMFDDIDSNLREMGVGDLAVGKKVKKLAESFYGRLKSYEAGLSDDDDTVLEAALRRNLFRGIEVDTDSLAAAGHYVRAQSRHLAQQPDTSLMGGVIDFATVASLARGGMQ